MKTATKPKTKKPLERHKSVLQHISANIGKGMSREQAVLEKGYSKSYARSGHIKDTRSWDVLLKDELPDSFLMQEHKELFAAKQVEKFVFPSRMKDEDIEIMVNDAGFKVIVIRPSPIGKMAFYSIPNANAKKAALEFGFKLKGKFAPEEYNLKFKGFSKNQLIDTILSKITKKK